MKEEKKRFLIWKLRNGMTRCKKIRAGVLLAALFLTLGASSVKASSYGGDYRFWSQGGSDYQGMRDVGCLITAQAKMLYEANVIRDASFNPDAWYDWLVANGKIAGGKDLNMRDHAAPAQYADSVGKQLEYLGKWNADDAQLWFNINQGYYTIVHVSGANTGGEATSSCLTTLCRGRREFCTAMIRIRIGERSRSSAFPDTAGARGDMCLRGTILFIPIAIRPISRGSRLASRRA